jgi:hypothetical protein
MCDEDEYYFFEVRSEPMAEGVVEVMASVVAQLA